MTFGIDHPLPKKPSPFVSNQLHDCALLLIGLALQKRNLITISESGVSYTRGVNGSCRSAKEAAESDSLLRLMRDTLCT
ncbi:MAG: hypothetical protein AAFY02_19335, partial [Pseudomonadota bacterium]